MRKIVTTAVAGLTAIASVLSAVPASAQSRWDRNGNGVPDYREYHRDRDYDRYDNRSDYRWHRYGAAYGYDGYDGRWRTGQRYPYWNNSRYYVNDYGAYDLPPPRRGYRYYRDDNGDIVMAAIGSGIIGMILGSAISDNHHHRW